MRGKLVIAGASAIVGIGVGLVGTTEPVAAHHAFAAEFDAERPVEFRGTVTSVEWINPHVWIHVDVTKDDGTVEPWAFEAGTTERVVQTRLYAPVSSAWCGGARRRLSSKGWHQSGEWPRHHGHRWNQTVPRVVGHRRPLRARPTRRRYRRPASLTTANWRTSRSRGESRFQRRARTDPQPPTR